MKKRSLFILGAVCLLMLIVLVSAIDFNPNGDIELRNIWKIKNATSITTQNLTASVHITAPIINVTQNITVGNSVCLNSNCSHRIYYNGSATIIS